MRPTQPSIQWLSELFPGRCMKVTTNFHLVPRFIMNGAKPLHPLFAFMAWTAIPLLLLSPRSSTTHLIDSLGVDMFIS